MVLLNSYTVFFYLELLWITWFFIYNFVCIGYVSDAFVIHFLMAASWSHYRNFKVPISSCQLFVLNERRMSMSKVRVCVASVLHLSVSFFLFPSVLNFLQLYIIFFSLEFVVSYLFCHTWPTSFPPPLSMLSRSWLVELNCGLIWKLFGWFHVTSQSSVLLVLFKAVARVVCQDATASV